MKHTLVHVLSALLGRHFWIPAVIGLALGFWLPGDYTGWSPSATVLLGGILFFSCLNVRLDHIRENLRRPRLGALIATLSAIKLVLLPLAAWAITRTIAPRWAPGVLLVSSMPAGLSSIAFTDLHRGNRVLALLQVMTTSVVCPLTVPLLLEALGSSGTTLAWSAVAGRALYILAVLLVPFVLAQLVRKGATSFIDARPSWWTRGAILCTCLLVFISVAINRASWEGWPAWRFATPLLLTFLASSVFALVSWVARRRLGYGDGIAFTCGAVYMNNGLAVVLAVRFFPGNPHMLLPAVLIQLPMLLTMALLGHFARSARVAADEPQAPERA